MDITCTIRTVHALDLAELPEPVIATRARRWKGDSEATFQVTEATEMLVERDEAGETFTDYHVDISGPALTKSGKPHMSKVISQTFDTAARPSWKASVPLSAAPEAIRALLVGIDGLRVAFVRQRYTLGVNQPRQEF